MPSTRGASAQRDQAWTEPVFQALGMRTALFAGDKESLQATSAQVKDPATRPDALLTELPQIAEIVGS
jgi:hypothetical protein